MTDSTRRFTGRVEDYARYRPDYPPELLDLLRRECHLTEDAVVADVGRHRDEIRSFGGYARGLRRIR